MTEKDLTLSYAKFCSMGEILGVPYDNNRPDESFLLIVEAITKLYTELREEAVNQAALEVKAEERN